MMTIEEYIMQPLDDKREAYIRNQFNKLKKTKYGFKIKIFDGLGNATNMMELTPQKAKLILKILREFK